MVLPSAGTAVGSHCRCPVSGIRKKHVQVPTLKTEKHLHIPEKYRPTAKWSQDLEAPSCQKRNVIAPPSMGEGQSQTRCDGEGNRGNWSKDAWPEAGRGLGRQARGQSLHCVPKEKSNSENILEGSQGEMAGWS